MRSWFLRIINWFLPLPDVSVGVLLRHDRAYGRDELMPHRILFFCFSDHVYALFFWKV